MRYNILLTLAVALVAPTATKAAIGDQFTKDGVRYEIFQEYTENGTLKVVAPGTNKKYTGDLTVPYIFNYNGKEWHVVDMDWTAIDQEKITSLDLQYHPEDEMVPQYFGGKTSPSNSVLKTVKLSAGFKKLDDRAFIRCEKLESIEMPGVIEIGEYAFSRCHNLTSIALNEGLETIPQSCFYECYSIKSMEIPSSVESIEGYAFENCEELENITIPVGIIWIGSHAFENCTNLSLVRFDCSDFTIGNSAFQGCTSIESIKITGQCSIRADVFRGCTALQNVRAVHLNESPGNNAFSDCPNLKVVYIGGDIEYLSGYLFEGSENIDTIGIICDTPPVPDSNTFAGVNPYMTTLVVPPASIMEYVNHESGVYDYFSNIISTSWLDDSEQYYFISRFNSFSGEIEAYLELIHTDENIGEEFTLPSSVTKFGDTMTVIGIRNYACAGLKALKVTVPNTIGKIGEYAFQYSNMKELWLPENLWYIGEKAFNGCSDLTDIYVAMSDPSEVVCKDSAFDGVSRTGCSLHVPEEALEAYQHRAPWNEFLNIEVNGINTIMVDDIDTAPWYNLQGIEVSRDRLTPGIYIHGGRKVMITGSPF